MSDLSHPSRPSDLSDLQHRMRDALTGSDEAAAPLRLRINGHGLDPLARLQIHRNTLRLGLTDVLMDRFPSCRALVGDEFWAATVRRFVGLHAPTSACLVEYGAGMAAFLRGFAPAQAVPYLADMAELDWAVHTVHNAGNGASRRLDSRFPVLDLWRAAAGEIAPEAVDVGVGGHSLLVVERDGRVEIDLIGSSESG